MRKRSSLRGHRELELPTPPSSWNPCRRRRGSLPALGRLTWWLPRLTDARMTAPTGLAGNGGGSSGLRQVAWTQRAQAMRGQRHYFATPGCRRSRPGSILQATRGCHPRLRSVGIAKRHGIAHLIGRQVVLVRIGGRERRPRAPRGKGLRWRQRRRRRRRARRERAGPRQRRRPSPRPWPADGRRWHLRATARL
jgi:hypothetical protein